MLKLQGRVVSGEEMMISFREFSNMCWKQFFEPVVIDDQVNPRLKLMPNDLRIMHCKHCTLHAISYTLVGLF